MDNLENAIDDEAEAHQLLAEEEYIASEAPEIIVGDQPGWIERLQKTFPAFEDRNFRLYFSGQLVSMVGTWLQTVAQGWLVLELTHSAFWVGLVTALGMLPTLFFALFGGVVVDRFSKRKIQIFTNAAAMALAAILGLLAIAHVVTLWQIAVLAFLVGIVNALDLPARQAFVAEMMPRERLASAIVLNSATFNGSRIVGPAFAGFLIALIGTGGTFLVNAVSFIAAIVALTMIRYREVVHESHPHPLRAIKEGLRYTFSHSTVRLFMLTMALMSLFGFSYFSILPVITEKVFHQEAAGLGYLYTASGIGALISAVIASVYAKHIGEQLLIIGGVTVSGISLFLFSLTTNFSLGLAFMLLNGLSMTLVFSLINTAIQHSIEDRLRGRVMSIFVLMFLGTAPFGGFLAGYIGEQLGVQIAVRLGALGVILVALILFSKRRSLDLSQKPYA